MRRELASGPTRAFDLVHVVRPRIFFVGRVRGFSLEVTNAGSMPWAQADRISVSYHWLSLTGEKIEGIGRKRTGFTEEVRPGTSASVRLKVAPPGKAGVYLLQWDVVQERVQWFSSSLNHPQFRHLVIVLPRLEFLLGWFLPALLALLCVAATCWVGPGRGPWWLVIFAATADLWWGAVSIWGKPQFLYLDMELRVASAAVWVGLGAVAAFLLCLGLLPGRMRPMVSWIMVAVVTLAVWGHMLHYRFFREVISVTSLSAVGQAGKLGESVRHLARPTDWLLVVDLVLALPLVWIAARRTTRPSMVRRSWRVGLLLALLAVSGAATWRLWQLSDWEDPGRKGPKARTIRTIKSYGLYGFQLQDLFTQIRRRWLRPPLSEEQLREMQQWFVNRVPLRAGDGPFFGVAKGKNLLAIQVESMQQFLIGLEIDGQQITPNLDRLGERALSFPFLQDQTGSGRSAAGEFVSWTSIVPVANSVAHEYPSNRFTTPAHALAAEGYEVVSAMPFVRSFWNRHQTYPAYGFEQGLWDSDFSPGQKIGWGLSDLEFLRQMLPRLLELPQPFCAWLTTLSLHYPYESFPEELKSLDLGELEGSSFGNYLHGMNLFDRAFGELMEKLRDSGLLESTVIALWGDHDSGLVRRDSAPEMLGIDLSWPEFLLWDQVPFLIWLPEADAAAKTIDAWAGQTDIAPTLLALFGVDPAAYAFTGRNLLGTASAPLPSVYPNGNWIDGQLIFLDHGESLEEGSCWSIARRRRIAPKWCRQGYESSQAQLAISEAMLFYDLQTALSNHLAESIRPQRRRVDPVPGE